MRSRPSPSAALCVFALTLSLWVAPAAAQSASAVGPTPPRLAFIDGGVSFWRPGAEDWTPAQINTALAAGDALYVGTAGNVEVEIGTRAYVRAGSGTEVQVESLETGYLQLSVPFGHAAVDLKRLPEGQLIEVDTPNGAFLIDSAGYYRLDVDDEATTFTTRRDGRARVIPAGGEAVDLTADRQIVVRGTETAAVSFALAPDDDAWDRWNYERTAQLGERPRSAEYVPPAVAGLDDLDRYGDWRATPTYGQVWVPRGVQVGWAPYSTGRWVWDGYYGWTWIDYAPWGWAPYHYGRWCWVDGYWGWAPGPLVVRPVYAPALVAFFGGPHVGVSVTVGLPFVSWVALGYGEPVVPWWGPVGFVGRPYWGGWGGPHVVNNVVINNTTIVNVHDIRHFDNFKHRHAVIGIDGDRFGRGRVDYTHLRRDQKRHLRPIHGELGVRPVRASLIPGEGRAERPPDRFQGRPVIATRPPQDPARQPHAAGLVPRDSRRHAPPRLVSPGGTGTREHGEGRPHIGRHAPPVPEFERGREVREGGNASGQTEPPTARVPGRERGRSAVDDSSGAPRLPAVGQGDRRERGGNERERRGREPEPPAARDAGRGSAPPPAALEPGQQQERGRRNLGQPQQLSPKPPAIDDGPGGVRRRSHREDKGTPSLPLQQQNPPPVRPGTGAPGKAPPSSDGAPGPGAGGHRGSGRPGPAPGAPPAVAPQPKVAPPSSSRHFGSMADGARGGHAPSLQGGGSRPGAATGPQRAAPPQAQGGKGAPHPQGRPAAPQGGLPPNLGGGSRGGGYSPGGQ